mgnify:CR=1 FL=1
MSVGERDLARILAVAVEQFGVGATRAEEAHLPSEANQSYLKQSEAIRSNLKQSEAI